MNGYSFSMIAVIGVVAIVIMGMAYSQGKNRLIYDAAMNGIDPITIRCAMDGMDTTSPICILNGVKE